MYQNELIHYCRVQYVLVAYVVVCFDSQREINVMFLCRSVRSVHFARVLVGLCNL